MNGKTILVVDDERDILELLRYNLVKNGYKVISALTGEEALRLADQTPPSLVILDLMLPGMDGLEVCRALKARRELADVPIIMLSAKGEEADIVAGLELGAHDYVCKPFSPRVLIARIRACLRHHNRKAEPENEIVRHAGMMIDPVRHEVLLDEQPLELTVTEFRVLHYLASRPGWVFTRNQIIDAVHGDKYAVTERSVDVQIVGLRKKLGKYGECVETVRGVGYRFREP
ncbi:MAG: response regulator transcription factor [Lentisphaeria bacterium]|jgi:two-component system phosphate regulon response regulator PhoB|nr:response regulator transcription factor [Lentisphaeria bacterium]